MIFNHPCKYCITRAICKMECSILENWLEQYESEYFLNTLCSALFILMILCFIMIGIITSWTVVLISILPLWLLSWWLSHKYDDLIPVIRPFDGIIHLLIFIFSLPCIIVMAGIFTIFGKYYYQKYGPT